MLEFLLLLTSSDKCCGVGIFSLGDIEVGWLVDDLFEWSSSVGFSVA